MRYTVGELEIDEDSFAIRRNGATVDVEPRVFDFLLYLIRHRQRVVSKGELLERVWHGYAVGESVLARCACIGRQVVGDPSAIRTIHARGYQWVAAVEGDDAINASPTSGASCNIPELSESSTHHQTKRALREPSSSC